MKVIDSSVQVEWEQTPDQILSKLERAGRTAYRSEGLITPWSKVDFVRKIIRREHHSVLEHVVVSARLICSRGVSHELVRHRIGASFTQESTRYCNYAQDKFGNELTFIKPAWWDRVSSAQQSEWTSCMEHVEGSYLRMRSYGAQPQEARDVLPNALKTEVYTTFNLREWLHFFKLRTSKAAHPDMRALAKEALKEFHAKLPTIFPEKMPETTFEQLRAATFMCWELVKDAKRINALTVELSALIATLVDHEDLGTEDEDVAGT